MVGVWNEYSKLKFPQVSLDGPCFPISIPSPSELFFTPTLLTLNIWGFPPILTSSPTPPGYPTVQFDSHTTQSFNIGLYKFKCSGPQNSSYFIG